MPDEISFLKSQIEKLKADLAIAKAEASLDHLTNLPTRRVLDIDLPRELSSVQRGDQGLAVIFLDLDNFKSINDTDGHIQGDKVLKSFTKTIKESLRGTDSIYRLGGEEFVVLIPLKPGMGKSLIVEILERYKKRVGEVNRAKHGFASLTASIGCLIITPNTKISPIEAIDRADALMYNSKHSGKNKSTVAIV